VPVRRLWARKLRSGPEVRAAVFYDPQLGEATLEVNVQATAAEDVVAEKLGDALRDALDKQGATEMVTRE
jgi:hypothetical protein